MTQRKEDRIASLLLHRTLGTLLISLHGWVSSDVYKVFGDCRWFVDFMDAFPGHSDSPGIYRYLNNAEVIGGASWFDFALISGSKLIFTLVVICHQGH
ncbi:hypothetical protein GGG16DRAFT_113792 [Schizophyllum commune]